MGVSCQLGVQGLALICRSQQGQFSQCFSSKMTPVFCESFDNNNNNNNNQSKMPDFAEFSDYEKHFTYSETSSHSDVHYNYTDTSEEAFETSENEGSIDMGNSDSNPMYGVNGYTYNNQPYTTVYYDSPMPNYESLAFQESIPENYISQPPTSQTKPPRKGKGGRKKNLHPPTPIIMKHRRNMANARERKRMNGLNDAFERLREVVPNVNTEQKMSKIETLLVAQTYIKALAKLMESETESEQATIN